MPITRRTGEGRGKKPQYESITLQEESRRLHLAEYLDLIAWLFPTFLNINDANFVSLINTTKVGSILSLNVYDFIVVQTYSALNRQGAFQLCSLALPEIRV